MKRSVSDIMEDASRDYYFTIGVERNNSRDHNQACARAALGTALAPHGTSTEVAGVIDRDRSTISHYTKNHRDNMDFWEMYSGMYKVANSIVLHAFSLPCRDALLLRREDILDLMRTLQGEVENINEKLTAHQAHNLLPYEQINLHPAV